MTFLASLGKERKISPAWLATGRTETAAAAMRHKPDRSAASSTNLELCFIESGATLLIV
jgi:hypothetical protein